VNKTSEARVKSGQVRSSQVESGQQPCVFWVCLSVCASPYFSVCCNDLPLALSLCRVCVCVCVCVCGGGVSACAAYLLCVPCGAAAAAAAHTLAATMSPLLPSRPLARASPLVCPALFRVVDGRPSRAREQQQQGHRLAWLYFRGRRRMGWRADKTRG
jgi:hypothetical protein